MSDSAAWLVDRILRSDIGWRQYVLTFPAPLAVGLCFNAALASAVTRTCLRALFQHQRARSPLIPGSTPRPAAVVWLQRFSDGAGAWFHLHILAPDGVFRQLSDSLRVPFEAQPPPTTSEIQLLVRRVAHRVTALLRRRGDLIADHPLLLRCGQQPARVVRKPSPPSSRVRHVPPLCAQYEGFSLHAQTSVPAHDRTALERLCRYLGRPPVPLDRLSLLPDGRVRFRLKRPRRGVVAYILEPVAFLARLAALVPPPMFNLVRYYGALGTASPLRAAILPVPPPSTPDRPTAPARPARLLHAQLLLRVFARDLYACPCGGRLTPIAVIRDPTVVQAILAALIEADALPVRGPPRRS